MQHRIMSKKHTVMPVPCSTTVRQCDFLLPFGALMHRHGGVDGPFWGADRKRRAALVRWANG